MSIEVINTNEIILDIKFELIWWDAVYVSGERVSYIQIPPLDKIKFKFICIPL